MGKNIKIFNEEKEVYSGNCSVNTVIFRGWIRENPIKIGSGGVKFTLQLSNGKDKETGEWNKATFADCAAFGAIAQKILDGYNAKEELWIIGKFQSRQHEGKYYKGFIVREIISEKESLQDQRQEAFDDDLPF